MEKIAVRVRTMGYPASSPTDLLSLAIARRESDVDLSEPVSRTILARIGRIQNLGQLAVDDWKELAGLEPFELARLQAALELGRRTAESRKGELDQISTAQDVADLLQDLVYEKKEHFVALLLDSKHHVMRRANIHVGTVNMSVVGAREVFREAIREAAAAIIVAHNHPSGDSTPSPEDIQVTKKLCEVGQLLDIPVLDHVIVAERGHTSLHERGLMR